MTGESTSSPLIVGRYAIFDEIASGGMATVHVGRFMGPAGFARTVAIKRLHPQFAKDPEFVTMFLDEARLAARISHPNVVATLDVVTKKDEVFLVMEYVQGESLRALTGVLRDHGERVPLPIVLRVATDVLQGLQAAHEARDEHGTPLNLVHRDVTPHNVLVGIDGVARLVDFGVAKATGRLHTTQEGQVKGKLAYMAPEQVEGGGVTRQTDLYAFAVVLWELATGQRLFAGDNQLDIVAQLIKHDVSPPRRLAPDIPASLDALIMRGLERELDRRFATARDMCLALAECGAPAAAMTVGDWVEKLARATLLMRAAKVANIEASPVETLIGVGLVKPTSKHSSTQPHPDASERVSALPTAIVAAVRGNDAPKPPAPAVPRGVEGEPSTGLSSVSALIASLRRPRRRSLVAFSAAVVVALAALAAGLFASTRRTVAVWPGPPSVAQTSSTPAPSTRVAPDVSAPVTSSATRAPAPSAIYSARAPKRPIRPPGESSTPSPSVPLFFPGP